MGNRTGVSFQYASAELSGDRDFVLEIQRDGDNMLAIKAK